MYDESGDEKFKSFSIDNPPKVDDFNERSEYLYLRAMAALCESSSFMFITYN